MAKRPPMRSCIGCGESREKRELIRIVWSDAQGAALDRSGRMPGRGAYLCDDPACLEKAIKRKALNRAFGKPIPPEAYEALRKAFSEREESQ